MSGFDDDIEYEFKVRVRSCVPVDCQMIDEAICQYFDNDNNYKTLGQATVRVEMCSDLQLVKEDR